MSGGASFMHAMFVAPKNDLLEEHQQMQLMTSHIQKKLNTAFLKYRVCMQHMRAHARTHPPTHTDLFLEISLPDANGDRLTRRFHIYVPANRGSPRQTASCMVGVT
eukprot:1160696-Pelagomonas_calceolata.AAC.3